MDPVVLRRDGSWTTSAYIISAVIGPGVLSMAWAMARLGWVGGPIVLLLFSFLTYYTSALFSRCYYGSESELNDNFYTEAIRGNLGSGIKVKIFGWVQYLNLLGVTIGYSIAASISMMAVRRSNCFHKTSGEESPCDAMSTTPYLIIFGAAQIIFSQILGFDLKSRLSIVGVVMSWIYSGIGLGLGIAKIAGNLHKDECNQYHVAKSLVTWLFSGCGLMIHHASENHMLGGSLTGIPIGAAFTPYDKIWSTFRALGDVAFAYTYIMILIEIQGTQRPLPSEASTMKRARAISAIATTFVYILHGVIGYVAFGDSAPKNLLSEFSNPFWILKIANAAIVVHLLISYQVDCKPLFIFTEKSVAQRFPLIPKNFFRLVWRTAFVITTTVISILLPFDDIGGLLVALSFWPLTVHYPVAMYINQMRIPKWSREWWALQILRLACLVITIAASAGYIAGLIYHFKAKA